MSPMQRHVAGITPRLDVEAVAPGAEQAIGALDDYVARQDLEPRLLELVRMRASQLNGCFVCLLMHGRDARARGETDLRLYALDAWREAPFYSTRERAALAWTEAVTRVADGHVPDEVYDEVRREFPEQEIVALTMAIIAVNAWNRLSISTRMQSSIAALATV